MRERERERVLAIQSDLLVLACGANSADPRYDGLARGKRGRDCARRRHGEQRKRLVMGSGVKQEQDKPRRGGGNPAARGSPGPNARRRREQGICLGCAPGKHERKSMEKELRTRGIKGREGCKDECDCVTVCVCVSVCDGQAWRRARSLATQSPGKGWARGWARRWSLLRTPRRREAAGAARSGGPRQGPHRYPRPYPARC